MIKQSKKFKAFVALPNGENVDTWAQKTKNGWLIGGDVRAAWGEGAKFFVETENGVYYLKGNRLIQQ